MTTVTLPRRSDEQYRTLRGKLAALTHWHPERTDEIAALRAEMATLALEHAIRQALAEQDLSAAQRHRIASIALGGDRR
ncbi:hypothetical protein [Georgenia deserti]|uniref:DUF3263 domain-containing protein n=1 Tax=Georgenia deserti TaxID=2093781 RepID=A0ABW4L2A9_9MICO